MTLYYCYDAQSDKIRFKVSYAISLRESVTNLVYISVKDFILKAIKKFSLSVDQDTVSLLRYYYLDLT